MPYDPTTGIISGAVGIHDVAKAIGAGKNVELRDHPNINMWAKYKPVKRNTPMEITEADRAVAKHGLSPASALGTAPYNLINLYDGDLNGWQYDRPRGVAYGEWFRLPDFKGYKHGALHPLKNYTSLDSVVYDSEQFVPFQMSAFLANADSDAKSVEFAEIADILSTVPANLYFGVALFQGTGLTPTTAMDARYEIATSTGALVKDDRGVYTGTTVSFDKTHMTGNDKGLWTVVPFLCVGQIPQCGMWEGTPTPSKRYYTLPYASISTLTVSSYQDSYSVRWSGFNTGLNLVADITFSNQGPAREFDVSVFIFDSSIPGTPDTRVMQAHERQYTTRFTLGTDGSYVFHIPTSGVVPSQLVNVGVGYIRISGEASCRGPYNFLKEHVE